MSLRSSLCSLSEGLVHLIYPPHCLLCLTALCRPTDFLCSVCQDGIFHDSYLACPRCGGTVGPHAVLEGTCVNCRQENFRFDRTFRLGDYHSGLRRDVVLHLKHARGEGLAELLGQEWAVRDRVALLAEGIEMVVPVPLHWWRRLQRGYNQSAALAYGLARGLGLRYAPWKLRRVRHTPFQTRQSRVGRRENVRSAFACRRLGPSVRGACVLLVDDVMTTGATASEAAGALKEGGAERVVVAVLARARG